MYLNGCSFNKWDTKTIMLIYNSRGHDGGFVEFDNLRFDTSLDFYSTYYFINLEKLLHLNKSYKKTYSWMNNYLKDIDITNSNDLININFALKTINIINKEYPKDKAQILLSKIDTLALKDGSFGFSGDNVDLRILRTYQIIEIKKILNVAIDRSTKEWLISLWLDDTFFNEQQPFCFSKVSLLIKSLNMADINISKLQKFNERVSWICSQEKAISSPEQISMMRPNVFYDLNEMLEINKILGLKDRLPENTLNSLIKRQLEDGGYNEQNYFFSEPQSTYLVCKILKEHGKKINNINKIKELLERYQTNSGYKLPIYKESSFYTTYAAIQSLNNLGSQIVLDKKLINFINSEPLKKDIRELYFKTLIIKKLNMPLPAIESYEINQNLDLKQLYYYIKLTMLINKVPTSNEKEYIRKYISDFKKDNQVFGMQDKATIEDTYYSIQIYNFLNLKIEDKQNIINFIKNKQIADGGFSENGIVSDLRSSYYAVNLLKIFNERPKQKDKFLAWLDSIRSSTGGYIFANPTSAKESPLTPDLLPTFWALEIKRINNL